MFLLKTLNFLTKISKYFLQMKNQVGPLIVIKASPQQPIFGTKLCFAPDVRLYIKLKGLIMEAKGNVFLPKTQRYNENY